MTENARSQPSPKHAYVIAAIAGSFFVAQVLFKIFVSTESQQYSSMISTIGLVGGFIILLMTFVNFNFSVIAFIFMIPFISFQFPGLSFFLTYADMYLIILCFVLVGRVLTGRSRRLPRTFLDRTILVFVFFSLCSLINTRYVNEGLKEVIQSIEFMVFCYYLFVIVVDSRNYLNSVVQALIVLSIMLSFYGVYQYFLLGRGDARIFGTLGHFNAVGSYHAMMVSFLFNFAVSGKDKKTKYYYYAVLGMNVVALALTMSRGAWIGAIVGIVAASQIRGLIQFLRVFALIMVGFILIALFAPPRYIGRLASVPEIQDDASKNRLRQYEIATDIITSYPLLGVGPANNNYYVNEKYNEASNAEIHNLYLHLGSERGLPAMVAIILIFISYFLMSIRRIKRAKDQYFYTIYLSLFSTMVTYGMVNLFAYQMVRGLGLLFGIFLALLPAAMHVDDNEPVESEWLKMVSSLNVKKHPIKMGM